MQFSPRSANLAIVGSSALLLACSGAETSDVDADGSTPADSGASEPDAATLHDANAGSGDGGVVDGSTTDAAGDAGPGCAAIACGEGERCELTDGEALCVENTCADLTCSDTEECRPAAGGGHVCADNACSSDVQCSAARHCDGAKCVEDLCEPQSQRCEGNQVFQCQSNGGEEIARFSCGGDAYYASGCVQSEGATAGCGCEDDWDCPDHTECNVGSCQGTGLAPTCTLPPLPFADVLPGLEFRWGGESADDRTATGRPFPNSNQVVSTPMVANLDDDNGDGLINELDFPEIIFMSYAGGNVHHSGTVRAVHGGGPQRGQDYFALCGTKLWVEGDDIAGATCANDEGTTRPGGGLAVGDVDGDGVPELLVTTESGTLLILDNRGNVLSESEKAFYAQGDAAPNNDAWKYPQVALANLDNTGLAEVIVGNRVLTLEKTLAGSIQVVDVFTGAFAEGAQDDSGRHFGPMACPANLIDADPDDTDVSQEIVVGTSLYALPQKPSGVTRRSECAGGDTSDFCAGTLTLLWDAQTVNGNSGASGVPGREGFCAVADVLGSDTAHAPGPDNPLDRTPEVVVVSNGRLLLLRASDGTLLRKIDVEPGKRGGAPNIDDFDGDGFPEIAMASSGFYTVVDLQATDATYCPAWSQSLGASEPAPGSNTARSPGASCSTDAECNDGSVCNQTTGSCVCLHNGWRRVTEDDSSRSTSSSVFDFNGDGAAEVVYGDECYFRVYDGADGDVQFSLPSVSRTVLENPVVADVDNDGNAEIVFVTNNETIQCGQDPLEGGVDPRSLPNGFQIWGDESDTWVSARRIWNQHGYHVTNITEGGQVPLREPESWRPYGNRFYNTYRSQPRAFGVAPDLSPVAMQVSSPGLTCGQLSNELEMVVLVKNLGDLRVGPGVAVTFYGEFGTAVSALRDDQGSPLTVVLEKSLEPGASLLVSARFRAEDNPEQTLPQRVFARVDEDGRERECLEDNNESEQAVETGKQLADLVLEIDGVTDECAAGANAAVTVLNQGSLPAGNVLVRLYAGDPSGSGQTIGELMIAGPIEPGASVETSVPFSGGGRTIKLFGVADPLGDIEECNKANNVAEGPTVSCSVVVL